MLKPGLRRGFAIISTAAALSTASLANDDVSVQVDDWADGRPVVERAIEVNITTRGQKYFANGLQDLIFRNGYTIDQGVFPEFTYLAEEPIDLDRLPVSYLKHKKTLGELRDLLKRWLSGFELENPLISARALNISYVAEFEKLGIRIDHEQSARLRQGDGVVLLFEAVVPNMVAYAEEISTTDRNNEFLGAFGFTNFLVQTQPLSQPLKVTIPIAITLNDRREIDLSVLDFQCNLSELALDILFDRPMMLPVVQLILNGRTITLNQAKLEDTLLAQKPKLLVALQDYLRDFVKVKFPEYVNKAINDGISQPLSEVNEMDPPGAPDPGKLTPADRYRWGVRPESFTYKPNYLQLEVAAYVEDPKATDKSQSAPPTTYRPPALNLIPHTEYDVALAINQDLINQILYLSFKRGYFEEMKLDEKEILRLVTPPVIRADQNTLKDMTRLHLRIAHNPSWAEGLAVRDPLEFEVDVNLKLKLTPKGISIVMAKIDENSLVLGDDMVKVKALKKTVYKGIQKNLREANKGLAAEEMELGQFPIPPRLGGVPIRIKDFESDRNGYLVVYVEYAFESTTIGDFK